MLCDTSVEMHAHRFSMKHATIKTGEYEIPLIGVPLTATEMECECCHDILHITGVHLNREGNQFLCEKCLKDF